MHDRITHAAANIDLEYEFIIKLSWQLAFDTVAGFWIVCD